MMTMALVRGRHLLLDVVQIGVPLVLLVADVVNGVAARERDAGGPQRVVGAGDQDLVAVLDQRVHGELDELGHAVAGVDVLHLDAGDVQQLRVLHDRLARGEQAAGVRVALALGELLAHVEDDLVGRAETEGRRVADVELEDAGAVLLHAARLVDDGTADIVEDVIELGGFLELAHGGAPLRLRCRGVDKGAGGGRRKRRIDRGRCRACGAAPESQPSPTPRIAASSAMTSGCGTVLPETYWLTSPFPSFLPWGLSPP